MLLKDNLNANSVNFDIFKKYESNINANYRASLMLNNSYNVSPNLARTNTCFSSSQY